MRLGDLLAFMKVYTRDGCAPLSGSYADVMDVLEELSETAPSNVRHSFGSAGGLQFASVNLENVVRWGLISMVEAHRHVETARIQARKIDDVRQAKIARAEFDRSG